MQFGYSERCLEHDPGPRHPETPDRLRAIKQGLARHHGVAYREASPATEAAVTAVHSAGYIDEFRSFCATGGGPWDQDTVAVEETWDAALQSAGLAQWAAERALAGEQGRETPFSLGRPPGHHAVEDDAMGFCFINNSAVAAQAVIDSGDADRVAIFDWDVHHGNGIQDIFDDRPDVFYGSIHEDGLYPGTGAIVERGVGDGEGTTVNAPLSAGAGDAEYLHLVDRVVGPLLRRYDPDLLLISAGFDAHRHDPISRMRLSTEGYALMTDRLRSIAAEIDAPIAFVLEGGYGLETLADGVAIVHETFDGREPIPCEEEPDEDAQVVANRLVDSFDL